MRARYLLFLIPLLLVGVALPAHAADFIVYAQKNWKKISQDGENAIYKNSLSKSNEMVLVQSFKPQAKDAELLNTMTAAELSRQRAKMMAVFGIHDYTVLDISRPPSRSPNTKRFVEVASMYRNLSNHDVQMVEWQYLTNSKMFVVTYLIDAPAINSHQYVKKILEDFKPKIPRQVSLRGGVSGMIFNATQSLSSEAYAEDTADSVSAPNAPPPPTDTPSTSPGGAPDPIQETKMSSADIDTYCKDVPANRRRKASDATFMGQMKADLTVPYNCMAGVLQNAWGIVKSLYQLASAGAQYLFSSAYRSQVNATIGVIVAEYEKDKTAFMERVAGEVYNAAKKSVGQFFECLSPEAQMQSTCSLLSNLVPAGLIAKLLLKVTMSAADLLKLGKLARAAVGQVEVVAEVAGDTHAGNTDPGVLTKADPGLTTSTPAVKKIDLAVKKVSPPSDGDTPPPAAAAANPSPATKAPADVSPPPAAAPSAAPEVLQPSPVQRAQLANTGQMPSVWRRPLSQAENQNLTTRLAGDSTMNTEYNEIQARASQLVAQKAQVVPVKVQDQFMANLNRAISNLKPGEHLNISNYTSLLDDALKARPGSPEAKAALKALQTQTNIFRAINAQSGTTFAAKLDGFIARVKLRLRGVPDSDIELFKTCVLSPKLMAAMNPHANSCLAIAAHMLNPGAGHSDLATTDNVVRDVIASAKQVPIHGLTDQSDLLAEAARVDIANRAGTYQRLLKENPMDPEIRRFNTIFIGGGPQTTAVGNLQGTRTLVLNESHDMGTFAKFGDTFYTNSPEIPGTPSPNRLPSAKVGIEDLANKTYSPGRVFGNATEINLALSDADFLIGDRVVSYKFAPEGSSYKYIVETSHGERFETDNIVDASGMGQRKFPFADPATVKLIQSDYAGGTPRIRFVDDYMSDNQALARAGEMPLDRTAGKTVIVIGKGDGGAIANEYMLGYGPPAGYAFKTDQLGEAMKPKVIYWFGQDAATGAAYKEASWERYWDLADEIDSGKVVPVNGKAARIEEITSGPDKGRLKVYYGSGPNDFKITDEVVVAAGYDTSGPSKLMAGLATDGRAVETKMVTGNPEGNFPRDVNIAKQVVVDGKPQQIYQAGPATGGLDTVGESGGPKSPRIEVMGTRTGQLTKQIRESITDPKTCLTCGDHGLGLELEPRRSPITVETNFEPAVTPLRIASEPEREVRVEFRLRSLLSGVKVDGDAPMTITITPNGKLLNFASNDLDADGLNKVSVLLQRDPQLMSLIASQPEDMQKSIKIVRYGSQHLTPSDSHTLLQFSDIPVMPKELQQALLKPGNDAAVLRSVATQHVPMAQLDTEIQRLKGLSASDKLKMHTAMSKAYRRADDIRSGYSDLVTLSPQSEGTIIDKISQLEARKIPRQKIRDNIKKWEAQCPAP